jgi:prevent-host-death family protein
MTTIAAGQAKAQFLRLLKDVEMKRETVIVTKHGRQVAKLVPMELAEDADPLDRFHYPGLQIVGDIESPLYTDAEWDEFEKASLAQLNDRS